MKSKKLLPGCGRRTVIKSGRSRILISLIATISLAAILLLYYVDLDAWLLYMVAIFVLFNLRQHIVAENQDTSFLSLQQGGPLLFKNSRHPGWQDVAITESFVTRWIIVLSLRSLVDSKKYSLVYAVDSTNRLSYRRLVIYLGHLQS